MEGELMGGGRGSGEVDSKSIDIRLCPGNHLS